MVSVRLLKANNRGVFSALKEKNVIVKVLPRYNALRFSLHLFNTEADVDRMVQLLSMELAG